MAAARTDALVDRVGEVLAARALADADTPALLMVSGGSDSTALAYIACDLRERGMLGQLAMLHVNHQLRVGFCKRSIECKLNFFQCTI